MCWKCAKPLPQGNIGFRDICSCGKELHVCKHCQFFELGLHNDCSEPQAEPVQEKDRMNFCDFFRPDREKVFEAKENSNNAKDDFNKLFNF